MNSLSNSTLRNVVFTYGKIWVSNARKRSRSSVLIVGIKDRTVTEKSHDHSSLGYKRKDTWQLSILSMINARAKLKKLDESGKNFEYTYYAAAKRFLSNDFQTSNDFWKFCSSEIKNRDTNNVYNDKITMFYLVGGMSK